MLNRKGHAPTLLLFVAALVLCIAAWFSFLTFNDGIKEKSSEIQAFSERLEFDRAYAESSVRGLVLSSAREAFESVRGDYEWRFDNALAGEVSRFSVLGNLSGNALGLMRNHAYKLNKDGENYVFELDNVFTQTETGSNKAVQRFNVTLAFSPSGAIR